ncbi:MAG: hypothetical protein RLP02_24380 [Coleofasciculus sp. C2-GNP5-27]
MESLAISDSQGGFSHILGATAKIMVKPAPTQSQPGGNPKILHQSITSVKMDHDRTDQPRYF